MAIKLRQPQQRLQGVKVMIYGSSGAGKSRYSLSGWENQIIVDSEAKIGTVEGNEKYNQNIVGILDSSNYYDYIELMEEIIKNPSMCSTLVVDSESNIYNNTQMACLEVEEERARKKKKEIEDSNLSQRSWGRIKNNYTRSKLLRQQLSAQGINLIVVAQEEPVKQKVGDEMVVVGTKPVIQKTAEFEYDIILRFFKERNMGTGEMQYKCEVEKDTTDTFKVGAIIQNPTYENTFKSYMDSRKNLQAIKTTDYSNAVNKDIAKMTEEGKSFDDTVKEFVELFKELKAKDEDNTAKVQTLLQEHGIKSYKDQETADELAKVVAILKTM